MPSVPRRKDRMLSHDEAVALLDAADYGVLTTVGPDGTPYGVPLNYVRDGDTLILHGALEGRKADNIRNDNRVSFCVVGRSEPVWEKFTTRYASVVLAGRAEWVEEAGRKSNLLMKLCARFAPADQPGSAEAAKKYIDKYLDRTGVLLLRIETISGKANRLDS